MQNKRRMLTFGLAAVFMVALCFMVWPAGAQQAHQVSPGDSVQEAIDNAQAGDVIVLQAGEHQGPITVGKPLTIRGEDGAVLDGGGATYVIDIAAPAVSVEDLAIQGTVAGIRIDAEAVNLFEGSTQSGFNLSGNIINVTQFGIDIAGDVISGYSISIINNQITTTSDHGIVFDDEIDNSIVEIIDNRILTPGAQDQGIRFYQAIKAQSEVTIEQNEITAGEAGILLDGGNSSIVDSSVFIRNNQVSAGVNVMRIDGATGGEIQIMANTVTGGNNANGIYASNALNSEVTIAGNTASGYDSIKIGECYDSSFFVYGNTVTGSTGIDITDIYDSPGNPVVLHIYDNKIYDCENYGLELWDVVLSNSDSSLFIAFNNFLNNRTGLYFDYSNAIAEGVSFIITGNSFTGNAEYGLNNTHTAYSCPAQHNWWGAADGPTNSPGSGDRVSVNVDFSPWLAALSISPSGAEAAVGEEVPFTATLLHSEDGQVFTSELLVRFTVSGSNNLTRDVRLSGGEAVFSYTGAAAGTDTVTAELLFANEGTGLLSESATVVWTSAPPDADDDETTDGTTEETELPRTGGYSHLGFAGLLLALGGTMILRRFHTGQGKA